MNTIQIQDSIENACRRIAPAWPLETSVAVNPYLGFANVDFEQAAQMLKVRGGVEMYMPIAFYLKRLDQGDIQKEDLLKAIEKRGLHSSVDGILNLAKCLKDTPPEIRQIPTVSECLEHDGLNLTTLMVNQTSSWLADYFNTRYSGQVTSKSLFESWKTDAAIDKLPELSGIKGFRTRVAGCPKNPTETIALGLKTLQVPQEEVENYLHALLLKLTGWASYAAGLDWQNNLYGGRGNYLKALMAILVAWEMCLLESYKNLESRWKKALDTLPLVLAESQNNDYQEIQSLLQEAFDFANQRWLKTKFETQQDMVASPSQRPQAQMVFCIDVRSEIYRRQLEMINNQIETIGFAGFFGFPIAYSPLVGSHSKNQCPALISSGPKVFETTQNATDLKSEQKARHLKGQLEALWLKFKSGTVASFGFVSPLGLFYLPKLISDSLGWTRPIKDPKKAEFGSLLSGEGQLDITSIPLEDRIKMGHSALTNMGLTKCFAPLVLITGHGSSSVNNPHASGLDCGACGGSSGEVNAITAQLILNDTRVRQALRERGIDIPQDTHFLASLHDTTTDDITIINETQVPSSHANQLKNLKASLTLASQKARQYRAPRFGLSDKSAEKILKQRAKDWSQTRPEWGLAGCSAFIVAPRNRTRGMDLEGKAFLHSYHWKSDPGFKVLESIMTAPMVVTSWINLQYYGSTTDNKHFGAGNKTLHNVTSGIGVLEGAKGDLRIGLPLQSIHDGTDYQHLPLRLNVVIEAPKEAINNILKKHPEVKELCDHSWITILILDDSGTLSQRYVGHYTWENITHKQRNSRSKVEHLVETI